MTLAPVKPTVASFTEQTRKRFGPAADALLKVYAPTTDAEAIEVAAALASDTFIGYATWKWIQVHAATTKVPGLPVLSSIARSRSRPTRR